MDDIVNKSYGSNFFDFEDELQQLIDRAVDEGVDNDTIIGELEMAAQQMRDAIEEEG